VNSFKFVRLVQFAFY